MSTDDRGDLFCLHCGYNLRGQSGDPRRCPECGRQSSVADMLLPADQIRKALRRLETGPALATAMFVAIVAWLGPVCFILASPRVSPANPTLWTSVLAMIGVCALLWFVGVWKFRSSAGNHPAWVGALVRYHLYGLAVSACFLVMLLAVSRFILTVVRVQSTAMILPLATSAVLIPLCFLAMRWAAERAKRTIAPIQRARAAEMIRDYKHRGKE